MSPTRRRAPSVLTSSSKRVRISDAIEVIGSSGDSHTIVHSVSSVDAKGELGKPCLRSTEKPVASSKQQSPTMKEKGPGKRGRGRPKKITTATGPIKRGRGRPKTAPTAKPGSSNVVPAKRATVKSSGRAESVAAEDNDGVDEQIQADLNFHIDGFTASNMKAQGQDHSSKDPGIAARGNGQGNIRNLDSARPDNEADEEDEEDERQYWLMKVDTTIRIANAMHGLYQPLSLLKRAEEPRPFVGVRNIAARNNLRAMKLGDLAFFYDDTLNVPGIVGVVSIAREHSIDKFALNPRNLSYDPKSTRDKPRWDRVHVQLERKYQRCIPLTDLKQYARSGGILENMQLMKQPRLMVSQVSLREWRFIMNLADEDELSEDSGEESVSDEEEVGNIACDGNWGPKGSGGDDCGGFDSEESDADNRRASSYARR